MGTYLCQGSTQEDGITRALAVLSPGDGKTTSPADFHSVLLQLGARSTPSSMEGDSRPLHPNFKQLCEELDLKSTENVGELVRKPELQKLLARTGLGRRHCRVEVEKLFEKN